MRSPYTLFALATLVAAHGRPEEYRFAVTTAPAPDGMSPRWFAEASDPHPIIKRAGNCGEGQHPCLDIGHGDQCCNNDEYCFVNRDFKPQCCPLGSSCGDQNPCPASQFRCTQSGETGCCNKKCGKSTSSYLCAENFGGGCCEYEAECRSDKQCVRTVEPSGTAALTPVVEGCTTRQYKCPDGEGCCNEDMKCTTLSGQAYCAEGTPTGTGIEIIEDDDDDDDEDLSDGAIAGIAVGAVVGGGLLIGLVTWFCLRRRKAAAASSVQPPPSDGQLQSPGGAEPDTMTESVASPRPWQPHATPRNAGPTQDYFGPDAVPGPFTVAANHRYEDHTASPPLGGVPSQPDKPGDIAAPVEIDSTGRTPATEDSRWGPGMSSPNSFSDFQTSPMPESAHGRAELDSTGDYLSRGGTVRSPMTPPRGEDRRY